MVHVAILLVLIFIALVLAPWMIMVLVAIFGAIAYWLAENFFTIAIFLTSFVAASIVLYIVFYFGRMKLLAALKEKPRANGSFKKVDLPPGAPKTEEHWSERVERLGVSKNVKTQTGRESPTSTGGSGQKG